MPPPFPWAEIAAELDALHKVCLEKKLLPLLTIALNWDHPEQEAAFLWPEVLPKHALQRLLENELDRLKGEPSPLSGKEPPLPPEATDILITTSNPAALDVILQRFKHIYKATLLQHPSSFGHMIHQGCYVVRCLGDPDFVECLIEKQGYGTVVKRLAQPL